MAACESFLKNVLSEYEPSKAQKDGAQRSHNALRETLDGGNIGQIILDSFLTGSYARDTAVAPLDDVDIVFVIDPAHWSGGLINGIRSAFSLGPSPTSVLDTFARAIRYRYENSSVRIQRRSVRLQMHHLDIDVVPALGTNDPNVIEVCDADEGVWIKSAPKTHSKIASELNRRHRDLFKPLVKLVKIWNRSLPTTAVFKSFSVETMASRIFANFEFSSLQDGLFKFFDFVSYLAGKSTHITWGNRCGMSLDWFECNVPDSAGVSGNTAANIDGATKRRFIEHAVRSRDTMLESIQTARIDVSERRAAAALGIR